MVEIKYINGDMENIEVKESKVTQFNHSHFHYDEENQMFIVFTSDNEKDCMMIPREFVKSIRHIEVE